MQNFANDSEKHSPNEMSATNGEDGQGMSMTVDQEAGGRQENHSAGATENLDLLDRLLSAFRRLSATIVSHITNRYEPVEDLAELNRYLQDQTAEVWELLHVPKHLIAARQRALWESGETHISSGQQPAEMQASDENIKLEFYEHIFMRITTAIMNEEAVQKPEYLNQILVFFRTFLVKFFAVDTECKLLCDIAALIFDWDQNLHSKVLCACSEPEVLKFAQTSSLDHRRIRSEMDWRIKVLQVHDRVDVLKAAIVRSNGDQVVRSWSRGTVVFKGIPADDEVSDPRLRDESMGLSLQAMKIDVKFEKDLDARVERFDISDARIAPLGTFTDDFEWRYSLAVDDHLNCMDSEKAWYKSTVLRTRQSANPDGELVPEVFVGFRTFEEAGSKYDEERKQRFFGWSDKYDDWFAVTDPLLQRAGSVSLQYQKVEAAHKIYQRPLDRLNINDRDDVISASKELRQFAVPRAALFGGLDTMPDALTEFGVAGGFKRLLDILAKASKGAFRLKILHLCSICQFLSRTMPLWTRNFAVVFTSEFTELLVGALTYVNKDVTEQNKQEMVLGVIQDDDFASNVLEHIINIQVDPIWKRHYTMELIQGKIQCEYRILIGATMLSLPNLQKRIQGIKYISESIRHARLPYLQYKFLTSQDVLQMLRDLQVMGLVFGGHTHFQIIHRSQDLVRLFFTEKDAEITREEIDMIWSVCSKQGQQIKLEVYKVILEVLRLSYTAMTDATKDYFIDKLSQVPPSQLLEKDIEIVTELGKKLGATYRQPEGFATKAAEMLWSVATLEKGYPESIALVARKKFCDQVSSWDDSLKEQYVALCLDNIAHDRYALQNLKIVIKLIQKMNFSNYNGKRTRADFSKDLIETQDFVGMIIDDLGRYVDHSNKLVRGGVLTKDNVRTPTLDGNHLFSHYKNLNSRLKRLKTLLHIAQEKLSSNQMESIWDIMVVKSELREHDQNVFFNWFKVLQGKELKHVLSEELMIDLFREKIVPSDLSLLKSLKVPGLECIVRLFVLVNEIKGNVLDLDPPKKIASNAPYGANHYPAGSQAAHGYQAYNPSSNVGYGQEFDNNGGNRAKFNRFRVNIMPEELEGIKILWSLLGAHDQSNQFLFHMVQRTLINIYSNLSITLSSRKEEIGDQFIAGCLHCLQSVSRDSLVSRTSKQKKESNRFICQMIQTFFEASEEHGLGALELHRQIDQGEFLDNIVVETRLSFKKGATPSFMVFGTYSNMTVWGLKTLIAKQTNQSPLNIQVRRVDQKKPREEMKDNKHCTLLSDLEFQSGEVLSVTRARIPDTVAVPLLDREGNMVPEFEAVVRGWFQSFSEDYTREQILEISQESIEISDASQGIDSEVPEVARVMTKWMGAAFASAITAGPDLGVDDSRLTALFAYSKALGNGQLLVEGELLLFFLERARSKDALVEQNLRENLRHQGIGLDLQPRVDHQNLTWENDSRVATEDAILPRIRLSQNLEAFDAILELVEGSQGDEAEPLWNLLLMLQTNAQIKDSILNNEDGMLEIHTTEGEQEAGPKNLYRILYCLQIMQSLIFEYRRTQESKLVLYIERADTTAQAWSQQQQNTKLVAGDYEDDFPRLDSADGGEESSKDFQGTQARAINVENIDNGVIQGNESQVGAHLEVRDTYFDNTGGYGASEERTDPEAQVQQSALPTACERPWLPGQGVQSTDKGVDVTLADDPEDLYGHSSNGAKKMENSPKKATIPVAPRSLAAGVGAPCAANTMSSSTYATHFTSIEDFVGDRIDVPFPCGSTPSQTEARRRKEWLPEFLHQGGVGKLLALIPSLSHFTKNERKTNENTKRIAKKCLCEVMQCVKILLSCSFCANSVDQDLALTLQRKLSTHSQGEGEPPEDSIQASRPEQATTTRPSAMPGGVATKDKLLADQKSTLEEMAPLIELLKSRIDLEVGSHLGQGLVVFQDQLLGVIVDFINRKDSKIEDTEIVNQGLSIWMSCLASKPAILSRLYEGPGQRDGHHQLIADVLIEKGLVGQEPQIRETLANTIRFIVNSIRSAELAVSPLFFFLNLLTSKLDYIQGTASSRYTKHYFQLLKELIPTHLAKQKRQLETSPGQVVGETLETGALTGDLIRRLYSYEPNEAKSSYLADNTLVGFLSLVTILFESDTSVLSPKEVRDLATTLVEKCLFCLQLDALETHITPDIDITPIEKKQINKCHAKESTEAAYELLVTLCKSQVVPNLAEGVIERYWSRHINSVDRPQAAGFQPSDDSRSWSNYCGIKNLGAVCYMNSMMQQFFNVPSFRHCLLAADDGVEADWQAHEGAQVDDNFLHQMMQMFGFLTLSDRQYYDPTPLCFSFKSFDGTRTNVREQKDAQEFLIAAFDKLENLLKETSHKYLLQNVFGVQTCQILRCKNCGNTRSKLEDNFFLSFEVKNQSSIFDGLRKMVQSEIISDWKCDACGQKTDLEKKSTIQRCPNTLIIHLQRITFDFEMMRTVKYNDRIEFPNVLNLRDYTTDEVLKASKESKGKLSRRASQKAERQRDLEPKEDAKVDDGGEPGAEDEEVVQDLDFVQDEEEFSDEGMAGPETTTLGTDMVSFEYRLVGVVCHMGIAEAGHYFSYINVERSKEGKGAAAGNSEDWLDIKSQTWLEFNDRKVSRFNFNQLEQCCFGGGQTPQNAYMLIYEKRVKEKMKVVLPEHVMQALASDSTTRTTNGPEDIHLFRVFPNLREQIRSQGKEQMKYDAEKKEHYALVDPDDAKLFVPNDIYKMVHEDNKRFLCEKQVFSDSFFNCSYELLHLSIQQAQQSQDLTADADRFRLIFSVVDRVIFDLLVNSASHRALRSMTDLLVVLLSKSDEAVEDLVKRRVFAPAESLGRDEKNYFEMICSHPEADVRDMASTIFVFVLHRLLHIGGLENLQAVDQAITALLDLMPNECQKHFEKLGAYFGTLLDLAQSDVSILQILVKKNTVARLVDLLCRYNPLYAAAHPPFEKLILTISFLVRSVPCVVDLGDSSNFQGIGASEWSQGPPAGFEQVLTARRGSSPLHIPLTSSFSFTEGQPVPVLSLPDVCSKAIFISQKPLKKFYENASKHGDATEEYARLIGHLCFQNKEFSRKLAKHILKGVNAITADEVLPFLTLMKAFLLVDDELSDQRTEWIFGIADLVIRTTGYGIYNQSQGPKLGVAYADSVGTQVCRYFSPLYKAASSLQGGRKECALQALLAARRTQSKAVLYSLKCILEAALADEQRRLLRYLFRMDPPTYQHARYWDWIKPWVENEVDQNRNCQRVQAYKAELELSIDVLSLVEAVETIRRGAVAGPMSMRQPGDVITYPEDDGGPKPYVMWDIQSADILDRRSDESGKIEVFVNLLTCHVGASLPTGDDNLALQDAFTNRSAYGFNPQTSHGGTWAAGSRQNGASGSGTKAAHHIRTRNHYGRGSRRSQQHAMTSPATQGVSQTSQGSKPRAATSFGKVQQSESPTRKTVEGPGSGDDADSDEAGSAGTQENVRAGGNVSLQEHEDQSRSRAAQRNVHFADQAEEARSPGGGQGEEIASRARSPVLSCTSRSEEGPLEDFGGDYEKEGDQAGVEFTGYNEPEPAEDRSHADNEVMEEDLEKPGQRVLSQCVLSFKVDNQTGSSKVVELRIKPLGACNFSVPISAIPCEVCSHSQTPIIQLTKLDPFVSDWGEFEWDFSVVGGNNEGNPLYPYSSSVGGPGSQDYNMANADTGGEDATGATSAAEKPCPQCTFLNPPNAGACEICGFGL